jgi:hypothetical protein
MSSVFTLVIGLSDIEIGGCRLDRVSSWWLFTLLFTSDRYLADISTSFHGEKWDEMGTNINLIDTILQPFGSSQRKESNEGNI